MTFINLIYLRKNKAFFDQFESSRSNPPASVDSTANGKVTAIKNQGNCGSCAAFTAAAIAETCMLMENVPMDRLDLSEQDLVDCAYDGGQLVSHFLLTIRIIFTVPTHLNFFSFHSYAAACNGATLSVYPDYIVNSNDGTLAHENAYPYQARRSNCKNAPKYSSGAKASESLFTGQ